MSLLWYASLLFNYQLIFIFGYNSGQLTPERLVINSSICCIDIHYCGQVMNVNSQVSALYNTVNNYHLQSVKILQAVKSKKGRILLKIMSNANSARV